MRRDLQFLNKKEARHQKVIEEVNRKAPHKPTLIADIRGKPLPSSPYRTNSNASRTSSKSPIGHSMYERAMK
jgi:hypothetical protein